MKKRKNRHFIVNRFYFIFLLFLSIFVCNNVFAKYSCDYGEFKINVDGDSLTLSGSDLASGQYIMDFYLSDEIMSLPNKDQIQYLIDFMDGRCAKKIFYCKGYKKSKTGGSDVKAYLIDQQFQANTISFKGKIYAYNFGDDMSKAGDTNYIGFDGSNECGEVDLKSSENAEEVETLGNKCNFVTRILEGDNKNNVMALKDFYDACRNQDYDACERYNKNKNILTTYCYSTIENSNFNNPCVTMCANDVPLAIGKIESMSTSKVCHLSNKIINFVANILKWGKYFAPVLVIILSIFDFIKSLASQKDEDMKKSQERFVKRLIAAALLFIVPFLIYFVLDKFKLITDDPFCNLLK